jgi:hypothetical protein
MSKDLNIKTVYDPETGERLKSITLDLNDPKFDEKLKLLSKMFDLDEDED